VYIRKRSEKSIRTRYRRRKRVFAKRALHTTFAIGSILLPTFAKRAYCSLHSRREYIAHYVRGRECIIAHCGCGREYIGLHVREHMNVYSVREESILLTPFAKREYIACYVREESILLPTFGKRYIAHSVREESILPPTFMKRVYCSLRSRREHIACYVREESILPPPTFMKSILLTAFVKRIYCLLRSRREYTAPYLREENILLPAFAKRVYCSLPS
jgi:hypothetical protein